jgi:predicted nucleic acid-binding Zn ribbon protein
VVRDDIDKELEKYQKTLEYEKKKVARINLALFLILIIVIIVFVYSLWRYQALN